MIQFVVRSKKNMMDKTVKFYPQMAPTVPMLLPDVIAQIERQCTVSAPDVKAVLNALEYVVISAMKNGTTVRLGELGSFRPTLRSQGVPLAKDVTAALIKRVRCRFTPSGSMNRGLALHNIVFQTYKLPTDAGGDPGAHDVV